MERAGLLLMIDTCQPSHTAALMEKTNELSLLHEQMALLTDQVVAFRVNQTPCKPAIYCYYSGHIQRQCPAYQFQTRSPHHYFNCDKVGHIERDCRQITQGNSTGTSGQATRRPLP